RTYGENAEERCDVARCQPNHGSAHAQNGRNGEALAVVERALPHFDRLVERVPDDAGFADLREQAREQRDWLRDNQPAEKAAELVAEGERLAATARKKGDWRKLREIGVSQMNRAVEFRESNRP